MALDDEKLFYIPSTSLSIETVHKVSSSLITVGENPEKRYTIALGPTDEAKKYVSTLKPGDKIIYAHHEGILFVYGPIDESKFHKGRHWA